MAEEVAHLKEQIESRNQYIREYRAKNTALIETEHKLHCEIDNLGVLLNAARKEKNEEVAALNRQVDELRAELQGRDRLLGSRQIQIENLKTEMESLQSPQNRLTPSQTYQTSVGDQSALILKKKTRTQLQRAASAGLSSLDI